MQRIVIIAIVLSLAVEIAAFRKSKALEQEGVVAVAEVASSDKELATAGTDAAGNPFKAIASLFAAKNQTEFDAKKALKEAAHAAKVAAKKEKQAAKEAARAAKETAKEDTEAAKEAAPAAKEVAEQESEEQSKQAAAKEEEQRKEAAAKEEQREKAAAEEKQSEQAAAKEKLSLEVAAEEKATMKLNEHTEAQGVHEMVRKAEEAAEQELSVHTETLEQQVKRKAQAKVDAIGKREERLRQEVNAKKLKDLRDDPKAILKRQKKQEKAERLVKWEALQARRLKEGHKQEVQQKVLEEQAARKAAEGVNQD